MSRISVTSLANLAVSTQPRARISPAFPTKPSEVQTMP